MVRIKKISRITANTVLVPPLDFSAVLPEESEIEQFAKVLQGLAVIADDKINIPFLAGKDRFFKVEATSPTGGVIINQKTKFVLKKPDFSMESASHISYEYIGGLEREVKLVREMVELPLQYKSPKG
jgi:transitional endoplasmic reticulum ATPase